MQCDLENKRKDHQFKKCNFKVKSQIDIEQCNNNDLKKRLLFGRRMSVKCKQLALRI